jgi:hypothetical protein
MNTTKRVNINKEAEARRLAAKAKQNAAYWANKKRSEKALADIKKKQELRETKKQKDETEEQAEKRIKKQTKARKMQDKIKKNAFAALCSDTDTDSEVEETASTAEDTTTESIPKNTWAGLVKGEFKVERKPAPQPTPPSPPQPKRKITLNKPAPWAATTNTTPKKSWAEMCDESSSDEEDNNDDIYTGNDAWD